MTFDQSPCPFCGVSTDRIILTENDLAYAMETTTPVTPLHVLVISKRHVVDYFDLSPAEISAMHSVLLEQKKALEQKDSTITGFNIGVNNGVSAGQTVMHTHIHLIPRRDGDTSSERKGVSAALRLLLEI